MPHIVSTDKQFQTIRAGNAVERHKQQLIDYIREEASHITFLDDIL